MKILIGADHAGFELKNVLKEHLSTKGHKVVDFGAKTLDPTDDYPKILAPLALHIASHLSDEVRGIVIGGSGQGEAMVCNRFPGIRAAVYYGSNSTQSGHQSNTVITLSREHNNANVLALGARFLSKEEAIAAADLWLSTPFSNEERHVRRINMLDTIE
jgi:ribose 5-phosphate isomerase B